MCRDTDVEILQSIRKGVEGIYEIKKGKDGQDLYMPSFSNITILPAILYANEIQAKTKKNKNWSWQSSIDKTHAGAHLKQGNSTMEQS